MNPTPSLDALLDQIPDSKRARIRKLQQQLEQEIRNQAAHAASTDRMSLTDHQPMDIGYDLHVKLNPLSADSLKRIQKGSPLPNLPQDFPKDLIKLLPVLEKPFLSWLNQNPDQMAAFAVNPPAVMAYFLREKSSLPASKELNAGIEYLLKKAESMHAAQFDGPGSHLRSLNVSLQKPAK